MTATLRRHKPDFPRRVFFTGKQDVPVAGIGEGIQFMDDAIWNAMQQGMASPIEPTRRRSTRTASICSSAVRRTRCSDATDLSEKSTGLTHQNRGACELELPGGARDSRAVRGDSPRKPDARVPVNGVQIWRRTDLEILRVCPGTTGHFRRVAGNGTRVACPARESRSDTSVILMRQPW
jgi:hypothetical protein